MNNLKKLIFIVPALAIIDSCKNYPLISIPNNYQLSAKLSDYGIFQGNTIELKPSDNFNLYELATPLFTDYSEKQRLIKLPPNTTMNYIDDKLPTFPDKSLLVKTFYYFNDKRNPEKGKKLIETRILLKENNKWNVGTYVWNKDQTEAFLQNNGSNQNISWIDINGISKTISYHIPATNECTTCHQAQNTILPIGPKLRNLNINREINGKTVNQLQHFQDSKLMNSFNVESVSQLPNWQDNKISLNNRARAYLDVNCAHCHNPKGFAADTDIFFTYETPYTDSGIRKNRTEIVNRMSANAIKKRMPKLGTTIIHEKGLNLLKEYIKSLK